MSINPHLYSKMPFDPVKDLIPVAAAARVLPVRERTIRRVYLALRALEYELNQELPALRDRALGAYLGLALGDAYTP